MDLPEIIKLTRKGELAQVPPSGRLTGKRFKLDDILSKFKDFYIMKPFISLVGSTVVHGEGNDIDLVIEGASLPPEIREAIDFRLFRQMAGEFGIPYDDTPLYLQLHYKSTKPYTSYIPLYALKVERINPPKTIQMSHPFKMYGNLKIVSKAEKEGGKRIIAGYANVAIPDKSNDLITLEALKEGIQTLLSDPSYANLMVVHRNIQIGKILPEYNGFTTHVDDKGLFIVAEIRSDLKIANEVWEKILSGEYNGFSIAAEVLSSKYVCDGKVCHNVIDKLNIFEVSVCKLPVNPKSGFIILSKCNKCEDIA